MSNSISSIIESIEDYIQRNNYSRTLKIHIKRQIMKVKTDSINEVRKGYCMRFPIPEKEVLSTFDAFDGFNRDQIKTAFIRDWGVPPDSHMYTNIYYHTLLLIVLYGVRNNDRELAEDALTLLLFKIWNGRSINSIKYCDPDTMSYVVSSMMNRKYVTHRYNDPTEMIIKYFTPTILDKYSSYIIRDVKETKRLFSATFSRIRQIFRSDPVPDMKGEQTKYRNGLQPLYFKAKAEGLKIGRTRAMANDDGDVVATDTIQSHSTDDNIEIVLNHIIMNTNMAYDQTFVNFLNSETKIKPNSIIEFIGKMHNLKYSSFIEEILQLVFKRLGTIKKVEMCGDNFVSEIIKKKIISSKHNQDVNNIKLLVDKLLEDIFKTKLNKPYDYNDWSETQKSQFRKMIIYAVGYNIHSKLCD